MNKFILFFLLIAGTANGISAQNPYYYFEQNATAADGLFNNPKPGNTRVKFSFFGSGGGWIRLELVSIKQMQYLPNLDSILNIAKSALAHISDSLKEDAINRKVDVLVDVSGPVRLRITSYDDRPAVFFVQGDELALLKTERDTLRIKFMVPNGKQVTVHHADGRKTARPETAPAFIMITMNNFDKLGELPANIMQTCIQVLRQDITADYVSKAPSHARYSALYNLATNNRYSPGKTQWIRNGGFRNELVPNIYGSIQYVRGSFAPSMAAGLRLTTARNAEGYRRLYLMWEPYFFFSRDAANKVVTDRNDFVTLRYIEQFKNDSKKGEFDFLFNFSLGYLTRRQGNWFEKNTIKVGFPAVRSGWLQLEPEFYFNGLVRNFSPGLKLTLHYE